MKPLKLSDIASACEGNLHGNKDAFISNIVTDSRQVDKNSLFAAIKGEKADGHDFIEQTKEKGAVCVLCEKEPKTDINYILVDSTLVALKKIAKYYRSLFNIPFIGITGSVGKTSTKEMISSVLSQKFNVHKTAKNFNNELGVPLTLFGLEEEHEIAVIEMGISDFLEMSRLSDMVQPDICVITNIGYCHLENLKDLNGVRKAKTEMFDYIKKGGKIYLNGDDEKLFEIKDVNGIVPCFYGINAHNDYYAKNIKDTLTSGVECTLCHKNDRIDVTIPALGVHMVQNALCAMAIAKDFKLSNEQIKHGIENFTNVGSRSRVIDTGYITIIDDCYNANPNSVRAGINTLKKFDSRTVAVIGDMKELGENEISMHAEVGKYIFDCGIDVLIAVGSLSKAMAENFDGSIYFETVEDASNKIIKYIKPKDTVLVKASHSMHFEKLVDVLKELKN